MARFRALVTITETHQAWVDIDHASSFTEAYRIAEEVTAALPPKSLVRIGRDVDISVEAADEERSVAA